MGLIASVKGLSILFIINGLVLGIGLALNLKVLILSFFSIAGTFLLI